MKKLKLLLCLTLALAFALSLGACALAEPADDAPATLQPADDASDELPSDDAPQSLWQRISENSVVTKLFSLKWYTVLVLLLTVAFGIVLFLAGARTRWNSTRIAYAAMCVAVAFVLSYIRLWRFPYGGSVTPASMLPLVIFSVACGPVPGALAGFAYGLLQLIQDPYIIHPVQMLLDYPFAFGAIALAGLVNYMPVKEPLKLPIAVVIGAAGRWVMAVLSGVIFFSEYAEGGNVWIYSMGYNFSYLGPDTLLCVIVALIPGMTRVVNMLKRSVTAR